MEPLQDVGLSNYGVIEFYFGIAVVEFVANFGVSDEGAGGNQGAQLANQDVVFFQGLKLRNRQLVALNKVFILFLADEFAVRKEDGAELPVLKLLAQLVVAGAQAHAVGFGNQRFLVDKLLGGLAGKIRKQHAGLRSAFWKLLADHGLGLALDFSDGHGLIANGGENAGRRRSDARTGANSAGNQGNRHRRADEDEQCAENDFYSRARILKLSNHSWITPLNSRL